MRLTDSFLHIDGIYTAFSVQRDKGYSFKGESHGFWEMVYVLDGTVGIMAGSKIFHLNKGEVIFHMPYEFHRIWSAENSPSAYLVVSFDLSGTGKNFFESLTLKPNEIQKHMLEYLVEYTKKNEQSKINRLDYSGKNGPDFSCFTYLFDLILCSFAKAAELVPENKSESEIIFEKVVNYMENNIDKNFTTEDFAKHANVSASTLKRIFLKYAYIGVHSYFLTIKMIKAKALLRNGESVYSVSKQLGYSNQSNFSLSFKRMVGTSPSTYKTDLFLNP